MQILQQLSLSSPAAGEALIGFYPQFLPHLSIHLLKAKGASTRGAPERLGATAAEPDGVDIMDRLVVATSRLERS